MSKTVYTTAPLAIVIAHCASLPKGDVDALVEPGTVYALAVAVDVAMACDDAARARYLAIWGVEWMPIVETLGNTARVYSASTTACTVR